MPIGYSESTGSMRSGGMAERLNAAVLKTVNGETRSGVRIPLPPPYKIFIFNILGAKVAHAQLVPGIQRR
jgi:hypothetical protein